MPKSAIASANSRRVWSLAPHAVAGAAPPRLPESGCRPLESLSPAQRGAMMLAIVAVGPPSVRSTSASRGSITPSTGSLARRRLSGTRAARLAPPISLEHSAEFGAASQPRWPDPAMAAPACCMSLACTVASTRVHTELAGSITRPAYRPCCWCELGPKWSWLNTVRKVLSLPFWLMMGSAHHSCVVRCAPQNG